MKLPGIAALLAFLASAGWFAYGGWTFTGPWAWLAEAQIAVAGSYSLKVTMVGAMIAVMLVTFIVGEVVSRATGIPWSRGRAEGADSEHLVRVAFAWIGVALLLGGLGSAGFYWHQSNQVPSEAALELRTGVDPPPAADLVRATGVVLSQAGMTFEETHSGSTTRTHYAPLVHADWKQGDAVAYFVKSKLQPAPWSRRPPTRITTPPSALVADGLPGIIRVEYAKDLKLAPKHYVLDPDRQANPEPFLIAGILGPIIGLVLLLAIGIVVMRDRKRRAA